jgi:hypothetical protein
VSRLASAGPAATRGQCNQPFVIAPAGTSRCRRMNATTGLIVSRASDSDGGVESDWMHGTARCFGYPSDSSPTARQQAPWTLPAETDLLLRLRRRPSASPPSSCLAGRSRARCHAGRVTGPGPGSGPPPLRLACRAPWARCGPVPRMPGPRWARCGPVALTVCCLRRGLAGPAPPPLLRAFSRGRMPEWRIATAQRRWDPALAAARLVGVRCWGRHCRMRIAVCVHRGPLAASHGSVRGRGPERRSVTAQLSWGTGAERRGPRRSAHVGRAVTRGSPADPSHSRSATVRPRPGPAKSPRARV